MTYGKLCVDLCFRLDDLLGFGSCVGLCTKERSDVSSGLSIPEQGQLTDSASGSG